ncbi:MAG: ATP-binding protein [Spirochaetia bacterium]|nr:ATP-binding protein [Spirochaetia bacterium]
MTLDNPEEYHTIFEHTGTAMALIDADHTLLRVNQEFARLTGFSMSEIEGKLSWTSFIHEEDKQLLLDRHEQRMKSTGTPPTSYEFRFLDRYKKTHNVHLTITFLASSRRSIVSLIDITEHKHHQLMLERRLTLERIIAESSQTFINATEKEIDNAIYRVLQAVGLFSEADRSYVFMFSEDEKTMSNTHEWCAEGVSPQIEMLQELPVKEFPWIVEELQAEGNINITDLNDLPAAAAAEKEILGAQDIQSLAIVPILYTGRLRGYLGFDSTRKQTAWSDEDFLLLRTIGNAIINAYMRCKLEHQLLQSHKMDAIGRLAGGIAHDFNNILATIQGNSQLLSYSECMSDNDKEILDTIIHSTESGSSLTRQLLAFSRDEPLSAEIIDADIVVSKSRQMLERLLPQKIHLHTHYDSADSRIKIDPIQLEQIIMNLVLNSADAMPEGGDITIHSSQTHMSPSSLINGYEVIAGKYLLLQIQDSGHGMSRETVDKAIEPFFTTKAPEKGTGLGLSTAYSTIHQNSGYMEISSHLGRGTRIDIYLPIVE